MEIKISDVIQGKNAVSMELGHELYKLIINELENTTEKIILDFSNIEVCASPFFNASIGYLFKDYTQSTIKERIDIRNIEERDKSLLNKVIKNAIIQYENIENHKKLVNSVINQM